jgi:Ca2+-dependent lipid-binding protein
VIWGNVNPQWRETHNLYVQERSKALLKLRVVDKNKLMSDVDLGVVMIGLNALLAKPGRQVELPLKGEVAAGPLPATAAAATALFYQQQQQPSSSSSRSPQK